MTSEARLRARRDAGRARPGRTSFIGGAAAAIVLAALASLVAPRAVAAPGERAPAPSHRGLQGPIGDGSHVDDPGADDCCGLGAMTLAARSAAAMKARPGAVLQLTVARVPGTPPHPAVAGEVLVRLREDAEAQAVAARHGLAVRRLVPSIGQVTLGVAVLGREGGADPVALAASLAGDRDVVSAGPNWVARTALAPPNDELFPLEIGPRGIGVLDAWDLSQGYGALVAVLDTGVDAAHRDLTGALATPGGFVDIVNGGFVPFDDNGHGTAVAGIIAARMNDGTGTAGVAPLAKVLAIKVADRDGAASYGDLAAGLAEAVRRGARVINVSLGAARSDAVLEAAVSAAQRAGATVIAAAGNENLEAPLYPAAYPGVLAIGGSGVHLAGPLPAAGAAATSQPPEVAFATVLAPSLALLAPSEKIVAPLPGGVHGFVNGTSAGAAHVAGIAALVLAHRPGTSKETLERILRQSADAVPALAEVSECMGVGRVQARRALDRDAPGYTDLAVVGFDVLPREPEAGKAALVRVRIQNQGNSYQPRAVLKAQYYLPSSPIAVEIAPVVTGPLAPGEAQVIPIAWTAAKMAAAGGIDVEVVANAAPGETETADNALRRPVTVVPASAGPAAAAHDTRIVRLEAVPDAAGASGPAGVALSALVRNLGAADETGVVVTFVSGAQVFGTVTIPSLPVGGEASARAFWPYAAGAPDVVSLEARVAARPGETRLDDNAAAARVRVGASTTRPVGPLYQQGNDVDLISDAPYRIAGGRTYVPLLLFAPSMGNRDGDTYLDFRDVEVTLKTSPQPGAAGTTIYKDATGSAPSVVATGITALDENGARQPTLDAFQDQQLKHNGRHTILKLPVALFGLGALPAERYLDVRMDWSFHRKILWVITLTRSGSNKKVLRVGFASEPLSSIPGDNHYYDVHFHSIAEWYFASWIQVFAPRKAYGGPLVMAAESAYAIGLIDDPTDVKDLLAVTDHNAFYNETVGNPDDEDARPPFGPSSPAQSGGLREFARYRELYGLSSGEEVCVEANQSFGAGPVSVGVPIGAHMVAFRGEHIEGPWHGGGFLPDPSSPPITVPLDSVLRTWGGTNQPHNAEAFGYAAHPFSAGLGWPDTHRSLAFGRDPLSRTLDHVHASPPGFVMKGLQLFNGRGARSLPSSAIDFDDLNPWIDTTWQAGNPTWDTTLGEGLSYWHGLLSEVMTYAFVTDPDGVFVRKVFIAGGSDAHGDFNFDISRLATPILLSQTFSVGSSPYASVMTYVLGDGAPGATPGERYMHALSAGRTVATDGPAISFTLDAEGRFDASTLKWHDQVDQAEDDDGRIGGGGAFDGEGTALVRRSGTHGWFRYRWSCASDFGSGSVASIKVYRDRPGSPNPTVRRGSVDIPVGAGTLAVTGTAGALASERIDAAEEGLVSAPTAYSLGAFTGGDPDVAPLGPDERRAYTNPIWALPVGVSVTAGVSGSQIAAGALSITLDFPVSMLPTATAVEVKPLDASGESTDGATAGQPLDGAWGRANGARDARLTLTNAQAISLAGADYPGAGLRTFAVYFRDPPRDLFGNAMNRFAFTFQVSLTGGGGSTAPPSRAGGHSAGGGGGGGGCAISAAGSDNLARLLGLYGPIALAGAIARASRILRKQHKTRQAKLL